MPLGLRLAIGLLGVWSLNAVGVVLLGHSVGFLSLLVECREGLEALCRFAFRIDKT